MWYSDRPLGQGHPDAEDDKAVKELFRIVSARLKHKDICWLPFSALDYQPKYDAEEVKKRLAGPRPNTPRTVDEAKCTRCELCVSECPATAITLTPYPQVSANCFDCFNCIRHCPEHAIEQRITFTQLEDRIRKWAELMKEHPHTQIFV